VTNYEVDKTERVTRNATGSVKRLNAAVVVNHRTVTDAKGKTTTVALTPEELEKLNVLVRETIGFRQDRGDSVKVINAPFKVEAVAADTTPLWKQPQVVDLLRAAAVPAALAIVALAVVFGLIRPALRTVKAEQDARGKKLDAMVADEEVLPPVEAPKLEPPRTNVHLAGARSFAKENPAAVASIVRGWVSGEAV
jgi:flagellar M-ring protein FliF